MTAKPVRILGIDPGSRVTGWGVIDCVGQQTRFVATGCLRLGQGEFSERIRDIFNGVQALLTEYRPTEIAIEDVFVNKNAMSALKLGQARGAAMAAVACEGFGLAAYPPAKVKQAIAGHGRADKHQISHMVCAMLKLEDAPAEDAADALAIAITHSHWRASPVAKLAAQIAQPARGRRGSSWRHFQPPE